MAAKKSSKPKAGSKPKARASVASAASFSQLDAKSRRAAAVRISHALGFLVDACGRSGYKVVHGSDQENRPLAIAETGDEFKQLTQRERNRLISFARRLVRNSDQMESILHQFEVQVVGTVGGKAVFDFGSDELDDPTETALTDAFASWAAHCEFFEDGSLNTFLKLALRTQLIGGDVVLVFDDDLVSDSGQIIAFEPDCIGNIDPGEFDRRFPGYTQTQGIIKDANSKTIGVIVSWSQRGQAVYELKTRDARGNERMAAWPLVKPDGVAWNDSLFIIHRSTWRFNQGHGSSGLWSALATLCDLTDIQGYEIQAAKKNAQTIGQVINTDEDKKDSIDPDYNPDTVAPIAGDDGAASEAEASEDEDDDDGVDADFAVLKAAGCVYDLMPKNVRMELFDTKHPNANMPQFISWLQRVAAYTKGLAAFHATGKADASYSATMAEIQLSQKSFDDEWHKLEAGILDWIMARWVAWSKRRGTFPVDESKLPAHWMRKCIQWERPRQKALNPVDEQKAWTEGLRNGSVDYTDIDGANWKRRAAQRARQKKVLQNLGLRYFPETDNNGMNAENQETENKENKKDEDL